MADDFDKGLGVVDVEAIDKADLLRHVLGQTIVPVTAEELVKIFAEAKDGGAVLPSGKPHAELLDPRKNLAQLERAGFVKKIAGADNHYALNSITEADDDVVTHPDPEDSPHAEGAYFQTETRGEIRAAEAEKAGIDPKADHWVMTKAGFRALTGHDQGEDKAIREANGDPA